MQCSESFLTVRISVVTILGITPTGPSFGVIDPKLYAFQKAATQGWRAVTYNLNVGTGFTDNSGSAADLSYLSATSINRLPGGADSNLCMGWQAPYWATTPAFSGTFGSDEVYQKCRIYGPRTGTIAQYSMTPTLSGFDYFQANTFVWASPVSYKYVTLVAGAWLDWAPTIAPIAPTFGGDPAERNSYAIFYFGKTPTDLGF